MSDGSSDEASSAQEENRTVLSDEERALMRKYLDEFRDPDRTVKERQKILKRMFRKVKKLPLVKKLTEPQWKERKAVRLVFCYTECRAHEGPGDESMDDEQRTAGERKAQV
jgi:hypothetical protein